MVTLTQPSPHFPAHRPPPACPISVDVISPQAELLDSDCDALIKLSNALLLQDGADDTDVGFYTAFDSVLCGDDLTTATASLYGPSEALKVGACMRVLWHVRFQVKCVSVCKCAYERH